MRQSRLTAALVAGAALVLGAGAASADTMHPKLAARLSGMGEQGIVELPVSSRERTSVLDVPAAHEGDHAGVDP